MTIPSVESVLGTSSGNNVSSRTLSGVTVGSYSNSVLIAWCAFKDNTPGTVSSVVLDPGGGSESSFTQEQTVTLDPGGDKFRVDCWYLINPPTGSFDITATFSEAITRGHFTVIQLSGVHQTDPIGATGTANGNTTALSVSVTTTAADSLVQAGFSVDSYGGVTPDASDTERVDNAQSGHGLWVADTPATTTGGYTISGTDGGSNDDWVALGVEILSPAAGGDSTPYLNNLKRRRFQPLLVR